MKALISRMWHWPLGHIPGMEVTLILVQHNSNVKVKISSYIAQYPVLRPAQSALCFIPWQTCSIECHLDLHEAWMWFNHLWCSNITALCMTVCIEHYSVMPSIDTGAADNSTYYSPSYCSLQQQIHDNTDLTLKQPIESICSFFN